jgi:hypothetical protein
MHYHPGGLVDDDEVGVFVEDGKRQVFRLSRCRDRRRQIHLEALPDFHGHARAQILCRRRRWNDRDVPVFDQFLNLWRDRSGRTAARNASRRAGVLLGDFDDCHQAATRCAAA